MRKFSFSKPTNKIPQTRPTSSTKRGRNAKSLGIAMPHKGSVRGRKPTLGQQYPRQ